MAAIQAFNSLGVTSTPKPGWGCGIPPCACCKVPFYTSDNKKTWGGEGEWKKKCCSRHFTVENVIVAPGTAPYKFASDGPCLPCCGLDWLDVTTADGVPVGKIERKCAICPCGSATLLEAKGAAGESKYTYRQGKCCAINGPCPAGCCPKGPGCCDCWVRFDTHAVSGPEGAPAEPYLTTITQQWNRCCPIPCCPWWVGYDHIPADATNNDKALLLAMITMRPGNFGGIFSVTPASAIMQ